MDEMERDQFEEFYNKDLIFVDLGALCSSSALCEGVGMFPGLCDQF